MFSEGKKIGVMLRGASSLAVLCHPARSSNRTAWAPSATQPEISWRLSCIAAVSATVLPINLPPVIGLGTTGGFEYQLESFEGADPTTWVRRRQSGPCLARVFSTYAAVAPSLCLDIDRQKAQAPGVTINDVFNPVRPDLADQPARRGGEPARRVESVGHLHPHRQRRHRSPCNPMRLCASSPARRTWRPPPGAIVLRPKRLACG